MFVWHNTIVWRYHRWIDILLIACEYPSPRYWHSLILYLFKTQDCYGEIPRIQSNYPEEK